MVRTRHIHCCGLGVQSLVGELRSHTPHGAAKKKKRRKEKEIIFVVIRGGHRGKGTVWKRSKGINSHYKVCTS